MAAIGGKTRLALQTKTAVKNEIGEAVAVWSDAVVLTGWLGLQGGDSKYRTYNAKLEESTHVFLCDYNSAAYGLAGQDLRAICKRIVYDVLLVDNPDEMNEQLEIYLRRVGAWDG